MTTLLFISFGILLIISAIAVRHFKKTYERIIESKDEEIRRLSVFNKNIGIRLPMLYLYDNFVIEKSSYYYGVYGRNADGSTKALIHIIFFYDDRTREKAEEEARKVLSSLNEWKSCVE